MPRRKNDYYPTPEGLTLALLDWRGGSIRDSRTYEPCAGDGRIAKILRTRSECTTADIDPKMPVDHCVDARYKVPDFEKEPDWIITNPPFSDAYTILRNMEYWLPNATIAFLLRLTFLEPTIERAEFLKANPPHELLVLPRTSFTADGKTDSVTCAWMLWHPHKVMGQSIRVYTKEDLKRLEHNFNSAGK
jgi:hypothetical protein